MSKRQFITLRTRRSNEEVDIELPANEMISSLMPDLLKALNWPQTLGNKMLHYHLENESGEVLDAGVSFLQAGIENFEVLWIMLDEEDSNQNEAKVDAESSPSDPNERDPDAEEDPDGGLPPPFWMSVPIDAPCLVSNKGIVFVLGQPPIIIGRGSAKMKPGIDLIELDPDFISSRQHAEIVMVKDQYALRALVSTNGMLINGFQLSPGEVRVLENGDMLQFGFRGVELVYRRPEKDKKITKSDSKP